jgi:hypothetical protein
MWDYWYKKMGVFNDSKLAEFSTGTNVVDLAKMLKMVFPCYIMSIIVILVFHTLHSLS